MADTITIGGHSFKKNQVILGVGGVSVAAIFVWYRKRQQAAATATTDSTTTDSTYGDIDPATGYATGSPEDTAALQAMSGSAFGDAASAVSGNGSVIGYDAYGDAIYGSSSVGPVPAGPGSFTNNAQWAQGYEQQVGSSGNDAIAAALGKYLTGQDLTPDQVTIIQEAIASNLYPPVAGPGGYPPSMKTTPPATGTTTTATGKPTSPPPGLHASKVSATEWRVSWSAYSGATSYNIQVTPKDVRGHNIGNKLFENIGGLTKNKEYRVFVSAQNSAGAGPSGAVVFHT